MTFERRLKTLGLQLFSVHIALLSKSDKKILHEITVNSQCYLNPFSRIVGFSVTPQLHMTFS